MLKSLCLIKKDLIRKNIFYKTAEELEEFTRENNIKLLRLLRYLRRGKVKHEK